MKREFKELLDAAREYIELRPAFRCKPIGAPHSAARLEQEQQIAAEDRLKTAIYAASLVSPRNGERAGGGNANDRPPVPADE